MLLGAVSMFMLFEQYTLRGRLSALQTRLESFAVTQAASLVKPLWEFDGVTVERQFRSYADVPELLSARVVNADGATIAMAEGHQTEDHERSFATSAPLIQQTPGGDYVVGRLDVTFHDGRVTEEMKGQRQGAMILLSVVFVLLAGTTLFAVRSLVANPLKYLKASLHHNASVLTREPLVWSGEDEVGDVVYAYNQLLAEIDQRTEDIHHLAYHDPLTQLPNRRLLEDRIGHALAVAGRQGRTVAVLFADIDNFKVVNDTLGHKQGDALLKVVAERMQGVMRGMDTVARWGGDEFVIVIENLASPGEAASVAEKLIESVGVPIHLGSNLLGVGVSIGISLYPQDGADVTALVKNADMALFEAKGRGRNTFHFFDQAMNARALRRLDIEMALRQGIAQGQLELHYQPKVSAGNGAISGVEALVRWRRPGEGLVQPDEFIPLAEESDLIITLGEWVLARACAQIKEWQAKGFGDIHVAVNLSTRHFRLEKDVDDILAVVEAAGVSPHLIEIEVTETTLMHEPELVAGFLRRLRDKGFGIAIDDFGSGYSNLSYLRHLPITTLKIDRAFVMDIEHSQGNVEIIRAIIAMGNALGLGLVAEGVETEQQFRFLRNADCHVIQGYYFSRPLPVSELETLLPKKGMPRQGEGHSLLSPITLRAASGDDACSAFAVLATS
jgi:diguanylate cyclase (GGDEF)-like protein